MSNYPTVIQSGVSFTLKTLAEQRFNSPSVSKLTKDQLFKVLLDLIAKTYLKCGQSINKEELKLTTTLFQEELHIFPYITIKELTQCFNEGYKEVYGKYYGLNVKTFISWIDFYIQNKRNEELFSRKKLKTKEQISIAEQKKLIKSGLKKCLEHYENEHEILEGYEIFLYECLTDDGYLNPTKEDKIKSYTDAKEFLEIMINQKNTNSLLSHRSKKEQLLEIGQEKSPTVIKQAKKMMVETLFRKEFNIIKEKLVKKYNILL